MSPPDKDISMDATVYLIAIDRIKVESEMLVVSEKFHFLRIE